MTQFILNNETLSTEEPSGLTVLDFIRYKKQLKGTKIGCREGDCGACTILVGELENDAVHYRSMTSCLTPLANVHNKHVVTVEGINRVEDWELRVETSYNPQPPIPNPLTPIQSVLVEESGTQCGFCTVGFVMSLTGHCLQSGHLDETDAIASIDGNICRCTGYKSIEIKQFRGFILKKWFCFQWKNPDAFGLENIGQSGFCTTCKFERACSLCHPLSTF